MEDGTLAPQKPLAEVRARGPDGEANERGCPLGVLWPPCTGRRCGLGPGACVWEPARPPLPLRTEALPSSRGHGLQVLREAKEKKEQEFQDLWKQMKQARDLPCPALPCPALSSADGGPS